MALIDKKITNPIRYHQDNANTVIGQASTMKALFDQGAEDLRVKLNGVIDELLATTGAQQIGIDPARGLGNTLADALTNIKNYMNLGASSISATTIGTGSGNTVQSQLEWLLLQIQNVVLNQIPDGTVTMDKLSTTLADLINGHTTQLAQFESYSLNLMSGNLSLPGTNLTEYKLPFSTQGTIVDYTEIVPSSGGDIKIKKNGTYLMIADATFSVGGSGFRRINILKNGTIVSTVTVPPTASNWTTAMQNIALINCELNDIITATASQNSGTSLDVICAIKIKKVG